MSENFYQDLCIPSRAEGAYQDSIAALRSDDSYQDPFLALRNDVAGQDRSVDRRVDSYQDPFVDLRSDVADQDHYADRRVDSYQDPFAALRNEESYQDPFVDLRNGNPGPSQYVNLSGNGYRDPFTGPPYSEDHMVGGRVQSVDVAEEPSLGLGQTFSEDTALRRTISDPYDFMRVGREGASSSAWPVEFSLDEARRRWEETGTKPVYDFGDPLEVRGRDGDLLAAAVGPRIVRGGGIGARAPLEMSLNRRSAEVLDALSNVDAFGLMPEAYRNIKQIVPMMNEVQRLDTLGKLQIALREQLGPRVAPTHSDLGAAKSISMDADGTARIRYDTGDLIDRYSDALRKVGLAKLGIIELDYRSFEIKTIGKQRLTPEQYKEQVEARYQEAFARAVPCGEKKYSTGKLKYPTDMPKQLQIGLFADAISRQQLLDYNRELGIYP